MPLIGARLREDLDAVPSRKLVLSRKGIIVDANFANCFLRRDLPVREAIDFDLCVSASFWIGRSSHCLKRSGEGLWIVENVFQAGYAVQTHRHTGPVYGYTTGGAWKYREYDYVNRAGSFLYEPAGSVHTLECIEDDTHVWFQMYGANLNLDAEGNVESIFDGPGTLAAYYALCEAAGLPRPNVLTD